MVYSLAKELEEAKKVIEEANKLEPMLRERIGKLEDNEKDLEVITCFCPHLYLYVHT